MKESMVAFRKSRKVMGFKHTSAYIPADRVADFSLYVERLKAERMMGIVANEPIESEGRMALALCNFINSPSLADLQAMIERNKSHSDIVRQCKECIKYIEAYSVASNAALASDDEDDYIKWQSSAVANNHMAVVIWREITFAVQELHGRIRDAQTA